MSKILSIAALIFFPSIALAQGNLSTLGLGYPAGELSARAFALGGGNGEFDPQSTINDAAVGNWVSPVLFFQYQPEYRSVSLRNKESNTFTSRFPLVGAATGIGSRAAIAISVTSFLDRSASAVTTLNDTIAGEAVTGTETFKTLGGINDVRIAGAYRYRNWLRMGIGGHAFTGQNRITSNVNFGTNSSFIPLNQQSTLGYSGAAISGGLEVRINEKLALSASGRKGGFLNMRSSDSVVAAANIPDRFGGSLQFSGLTGLNLSARVSRELWTALKPLVGAKTSTFDAWDTGVGVEATASRSQTRLLQLRVGARYRGLPFGINGQQVNELSFGGGFGLQFSRDRAELDAGLNRMSRSTSSTGSLSSAAERAFVLSVGLRVRP